MHVCLHQLSNDVDVLKARPGGWFRNVEDLDDVFMVEELKQLNLSDDTLRVDQVLESLGDFLDCNFDLGIVVKSAAHHTVRSMADLLDVFKFILDEERCAFKLMSDLGIAYLRI